MDINSSTRQLRLKREKKKDEFRRKERRGESK